MVFFRLKANTVGRKQYTKPVRTSGQASFAAVPAMVIASIHNYTYFSSGYLFTMLMPILRY